MTSVKLALRGIRSSIGWLILTTIAILAGVCFVSGSFILADSLTRTFDRLMTGAAEGVDAAVQLDELEFGSATRTLPDSVVDDLNALDEVEVARPSVTYGDETTPNPFALLDDEGETIVPPGPPVITFSWDESSVDGLITLAEGRGPESIDEVVIDSVYAEQAEVSVGDQVSLATPDGTRDFTLVGIVDFEVSGGAWFVLFDFESAQTLYDKEGQVDVVDLSRAPGVSVSDMVEAAQEVVPEGATVLSQQEVIEQNTADFEQIIGALRNGLLIFAGIALFVSLFLIYNTFAILVNQRLQQIGMLRAIGATKGQIRTTLLVEASVVGVLGSVLGLITGIAIAVAIKSVFAAGGFFPETDTIISPRTILVALLVGLGATTISSLLPAFLAGRVSPIAAMRNEAPSRSSRTRRIAIGTVVTLLGLISLGAGLFVPDQDFLSVVSELGVGAVTLFVGVAMLSGLFAGPVVSLLGRPMVLGAGLLGLGVLLPVLTFTVGDGLPDGVISGFGFVVKIVVSILAALTGISILVSAARGGTPFGLGGSAAGLEGRLARQNASRSPQRTAATATALTIGIALVSTVGVVGASLKSSFVETMERAISADIFIYNEQGGQFPPALGDAVAGLDGIDAISRFKFNEVSLGTAETGDPDVVGLAAYDSGSGTSVMNFGVTEGTYETLPDDGVLVVRDEAEERGIAVGDHLDVEFPAGLGTADLTVVGIFDDDAVLMVPIIVDVDVYERFVPDSPDVFVGATISDEADFQAVKAEINDTVNRYSGAVAQDNAEYVETVEGQVDGIITVINYLLTFALFIAFLGVVNTIVLSVIERTREIGLLRAVGMTQGQVRVTIRWESVIVCVFGALLGIVLGVLFAWAAVVAIPESVISNVTVPYETIMFTVLVAALAGVVAALIPAFVAARKNVLAAISSGGS